MPGSSVIEGVSGLQIVAKFMEGFNILFNQPLFIYIEIIFLPQDDTRIPRPHLHSAVKTSRVLLFVVQTQSTKAICHWRAPRLSVVPAMG